MNIVLKSKRFNTQQQWVEVWDNIEKYVTRAEMESAEQAVLADMKEKLSAFKKPIYGYSAGKDSIVLAELCRKADVDVGVMSITGLEYPAFDRWARENKPSGVEIISTGQDLEWLGSHPSCFLRHRGVNSDMQTRLNRQIQHRFYDKVGADVILLGRRKADGNYGGRNRSNIYIP